MMKLCEAEECGQVVAQHPRPMQACAAASSALKACQAEVGV